MTTAKTAKLGPLASLWCEIHKRKLVVAFAIVGFALLGSISHSQSELLWVSDGLLMEIQSSSLQNNTQTLNDEIRKANARRSRAQKIKDASNMTRHINLTKSPSKKLTGPRLRGVNITNRGNRNKENKAAVKNALSALRDVNLSRQGGDKPATSDVKDPHFKVKTASTKPASKVTQSSEKVNLDGARESKPAISDARQKEEPKSDTEPSPQKSDLFRQGADKSVTGVVKVKTAATKPVSKVTQSSEKEDLDVAHESEPSISDAEGKEEPKTAFEPNSQKSKLSSHGADKAATGVVKDPHLKIKTTSTKPAPKVTQSSVPANLDVARESKPSIFDASRKEELKTAFGPRLKSPGSSDHVKEVNVPARLASFDNGLTRNAQNIKYEKRVEVVEPSMFSQAIDDSQFAQTSHMPQEEEMIFGGNTNHETKASDTREAPSSAARISATFSEETPKKDTSADLGQQIDHAAVRHKSKNARPVASGVTPISSTSQKETTNHGTSITATGLKPKAEDEPLRDSAKDNIKISSSQFAASDAAFREETDSRTKHDTEQKVEETCSVSRAKEEKQAAESTTLKTSFSSVRAMVALRSAVDKDAGNTAHRPPATEPKSVTALERDTAISEENSMSKARTARASSSVSGESKEERKQSFPQEGVGVEKVKEDRKVEQIHIASRDMANSSGDKDPKVEGNKELHAALREAEVEEIQMHHGNEPLLDKFKTGKVEEKVEERNASPKSATNEVGIDKKVQATQKLTLPRTLEPSSGGSRAKLVDRVVAENPRTAEIVTSTSKDVDRVVFESPKKTEKSSTVASSIAKEVLANQRSASINQERHAHVMAEIHRLEEKSSPTSSTDKEDTTPKPLAVAPTSLPTTSSTTENEDTIPKPSTAIRTAKQSLPTTSSTEKEDTTPKPLLTVIRTAKQSLPITTSSTTEKEDTTIPKSLTVIRAAKQTSPKEGKLADHVVVATESLEKKTYKPAIAKKVSRGEVQEKRRTVAEKPPIVVSSIATNDQTIHRLPSHKSASVRDRTAGRSEELANDAMTTSPGIPEKKLSSVVPPVPKEEISPHHRKVTTSRAINRAVRPREELLLAVDPVVAENSETPLGSRPDIKEDMAKETEQHHVDEEKQNENPFAELLKWLLQEDREEKRQESRSSSTIETEMLSDEEQDNDNDKDEPNAFLQEAMADPKYHNKYNLVHVIQTDFLQYQTDLVHLKQARLALFETFTLPSMQKQSNEEFLWLIWVDPELPDTLMTQLKNLLNNVPNAVVLGYHRDKKLDFRYLNGDDMEESVLFGSRTLLEEYKAASVDRVLLETRLGADDALNKDFVESIQRQACMSLGTSTFDEDYRVFCPEHHTEWRYYKPNQEEEKQGHLVHYHNPSFCISTGLTIGYQTKATSRHLETLEQCNMHWRFQECADPVVVFGGEVEQDHRCMTRLLMLGEQTDQAVLLSRTPTSAGMKRVMGSEKTYKATFESMQAQKEAWEMLEDSFGVKRDAIAEVRREMEADILNILKDALEGQCMPGYSCKAATKRKLKKLLDKARARRTR